MNKLNINNKKGFTIIEVVLVLAIAGLIFLIVFLALPGLQRNRRDTARKSNFNSMVAALESYAGNHGGQYPANVTQSTAPCNGFQMCPVSHFLSGFTPTADPQGNDYYVVSNSGATVNPIGVLWTVVYFQGGSCNNNHAVSTGGTGTAYGYAISMVLENGEICKQV